MVTDRRAPPLSPSRIPQPPSDLLAGCRSSANCFGPRLETSNRGGLFVPLPNLCVLAKFSLWPSERADKTCTCDAGFWPPSVGRVAQSSSLFQVCMCWAKFSLWPYERVDKTCTGNSGQKSHSLGRAASKSSGAEILRHSDEFRYRFSSPCIVTTACTVSGSLDIVHCIFINLPIAIETSVANAVVRIREDSLDAAAVGL
jgi:hypothetical protein